MKEQDWKDIAEQMFPKYMRDQVKKAYEEQLKTARSLTEAARTGSYVVPNYEYMGYVLYIGDIDDEYDGIYMGGFDMDYEQLESNVRQYSYHYSEF